jgi:hypothetical protein
MIPRMWKMFLEKQCGRGETTRSVIIEGRPGWVENNATLKRIGYAPRAEKKTGLCKGKTRLMLAA